jgi:YidC/Oxa1 family membrane protein insertase
MERRLFLAVVLAILVSLAWSSWVAKLYRIDNKAVTEKPLPVTPSPPVKILSPQLEPVTPALTLLSLPQEKFTLTFIEPQAAIKEVIFKDYQGDKFNLTQGLMLEMPGVFQKEKLTDEAVSFIYQDAEKRMIKRFIFSKSNYTIELEIKVANLSATPLKINLPLILGVLNFAADPISARFQDVTIALTDKTMHFNGRKEMSFPQIKFLGLRDRYFCGLIEPESAGYNAFIKKINSQLSVVGLSSPEFLINPSEQIGQKFQIYLGPQEVSLIKKIKPAWSAIMYYGMFDFIAQVLGQALAFLYHLVHNWGVAIILLSLAIYLLLFPLTLKQMHSAKQMQALQPLIAELRKRYKDAPKKLNSEVMKLYRENKVNPFSGCLPLVLQIPIFFALYQVLMRSVALKGARFLWIKDLSSPDRLFLLPVSLPVVGNEINLLPILMTVGMFIQQKISLAYASGSAAEQQKLMLILFPLIFALIFYHLPAGLVLYWFINSIFMAIFQFRLSRKK